VSRSIHDTHVVAAIEWKTAVRKNTDEAWARADAIRANIHRQRSIRKRVRQSRARGELLPHTAETVPILIDPGGPGTHHGASERDLREVMRRLPPGTLDGLGSIQLHRPMAHWGWSRLMGVVASFVRGRYGERDRGIRLYAFEEAAELDADTACFLRISALGTFVHEVAHHFDFMFRTTGDRWRMDDSEKTEAFAHARALAQLTELVVPYLVEAYPDDAETLAWWSTRLDTLV